jgi:hypothetical protein
LISFFPLGKKNNEEKFGIFVLHGWMVTSRLCDLRQSRGQKRNDTKQKKNKNSPEIPKKPKTNAKFFSLFSVCVGESLAKSIGRAVNLAATPNE